jgi:hypothetical protein
MVRPLPSQSVTWPPISATPDFILNVPAIVVVGRSSRSSSTVADPSVIVTCFHAGRSEGAHAVIQYSPAGSVARATPPDASTLCE